MLGGAEFQPSGGDISGGGGGIGGALQVQRFFGGRLGGINVSDVDVSEVLEFDGVEAVVSEGDCDGGCVAAVDMADTITVAAADSISVRASTELLDQVVKSLDDNPGSGGSDPTPSCGRGTSTAGSVSVGLLAADIGDASAAVTMSGVGLTTGTTGLLVAERTGEGLRGIETGDRGRAGSMGSGRTERLVTLLLGIPSLASSSWFFWSRAAFSSWRSALDSWRRRFSSIN